MLEKLASALCLLVVFATGSIAQDIQPEYGDFSEIQGKHKVFLRCDDLEYRKEIIEQIKEYVSKGKVDATIVGREEDAEIVISYWNAGAKGVFGGYKKLGDLTVAIDGTEIKTATNVVEGTKQYRLRTLYS